MENYRIYARERGGQPVCFRFCGFVESLKKHISRQRFSHFMAFWKDIQQACRLALEQEQVPGHFRAFKLLSFISNGKFLMDKAPRILGCIPSLMLECFYKRLP
jgi:hypothetical protein